MKISNDKKYQIIENGGYFYHKTECSGWVATYDVGFTRFENEESLDKQIEEFGYNMFLSKKQATDCLQEIQQIYEKYKDK